MTKSLIPNATPFLKVLEKAYFKCFNLKTNVNILIDADNCPPEFLPFLAWANSVDYWDEGWPETTKRNVIKKSKKIHKHKGTDFAVSELLNMVGFELDRLDEWFNQTPQGVAGTFAARVSAPNGITAKTEALVWQMIEKGKPKSRHLSKLSLGISSEGHGYCAAIPIVGNSVTIFEFQPSNADISGMSYCASAFYHIQTVTIKEKTS